ncbi:unnamed protein product [Pleuronectes platessa]|uniref:Ig-like domain-containing protein n=1 Tax=Pleuronectes platessa TaxID=8262 RepID=A0A9N7VJ41_PLEPL|nr:unnamed protein product [Pleuronectes platessa]
MDVINQDVTLCFILFCMTDLTGASDVTQTSSLWEKRGDNATIHCSHTKGSEYYQMYWYKQLSGETMKHIASAVFGSYCDYGDSSRDKFSVEKPVAHRGTLTVKHVEPADKGLYFCAVSRHSGTDTPDS